MYIKHSNKVFYMKHSLMFDMLHYFSKFMHRAALKKDQHKTTASRSFVLAT